jgi:hypothetical protein
MASHEKALDAANAEGRTVMSLSARQRQPSNPIPPKTPDALPKPSGRFSAFAEARPLAIGIDRAIIELTLEIRPWEAKAALAIHCLDALADALERQATP